MSGDEEGDDELGGPGGGKPREADESEGVLLVRSFVVRAILEANTDPRTPLWHGFVTDVATGRRIAWHRVGEIARFVESRLSEAGPGPTAPGRSAGGRTMTAPPLNDALDDMLDLLEERLPQRVPDLPDPNVTIARVRERLVGLGNRRGAQRTGPLGRHELKGGRLDATVRYQLWGATASDVDGAVLALHGDLLGARDQLRADGFLRFAATDTSLAEPVDGVGGWRKTASYDVLYEYHYEDVDGARGLLARIEAGVDPEAPDSPDRETTTVTDEMVRWGEEAAPVLAVSGPRAVARLAALAFLPGPTPTGTVTVTRTTTRATGPPTHHGDLASFLAAVTGPQPADTHADVTVGLADLLAALDPVGTPVDLVGNGTPNTYVGSQLVIDPALNLPEGTDRFELAYADPGGFDLPAVVYLRLDPT